ncbi:hypothetical protein [Chitinophaga dinghuensis]|uniref:hypothetical protein n=1 Tax=Chitinophaga dinghuensis TaxID=1539050 RepID=UPI0011B94893|nr:hypothetical protein [Chitinophaga dinghuensis]
MSKQHNISLCCFAALLLCEQKSSAVQQPLQAEMSKQHNISLCCFAALLLCEQKSSAAGAPFHRTIA